MSASFNHVTLNVGGTSFSYNRADIEKSGIQVKANEVLNVNGNIFSKWIDPWIRYQIKPDKASIGNEQDRKVIVAAAHCLNIPSIATPLARFGAEDWKKYYDLTVTDVPQLPKDLKFDPTSEILFLIPKGITILKHLEMLKSPLEGHQPEGYVRRLMWYRSDIEEDFGNVVVESSYWVKMSKKLIKESLNKTIVENRKLAEEMNVTIPTLLEIAVALGTEFTRTGEQLIPPPYTVLCTETLGEGRLDPIVSFSKRNHLILEGGSEQWCRDVRGFPLIQRY